MVAPFRTSPRSSLAAVLVVLVLSVPAASVQASTGPVPVPTQPTPNGATPDLTISQGHVTLLSGVFINNNTTNAQVSVVVYNNGSQATNIPVFTYPEVPGYNLDPSWVKCRVVTVPGAANARPGYTSPFSIPLSNPYFVTNFTDPAGIHEPIHEVTYRVLVNAVPPGFNKQNPTICTDLSNPPRQTTTYTWAADSTGGIASTGNGEQNLTDNVAFVRVVRDVLFDPTVAALLWCYGDEGAPTCAAAPNGFNVNTLVDYNETTHVIKANDADVPWNVERSVAYRCDTYTWKNTTPDPQGGAPQVSCPNIDNNTHFEVDLSWDHSVIWAADPPAQFTPSVDDLRDHGATTCTFFYPLKGGNAYRDTPPDIRDPANYTLYDLANPQGVVLNTSSCPMFDVGLDIKATQGSTSLDLTDPSWLTSPDSINETLRGRINSTSLSFVTQLGAGDNSGWTSLQGDWTVTAKVNATRTFPEPSGGDLDDAATTVAHVAAPDFTAALDPFLGSTRDTAISYSETSSLPAITVTATIRNLGDAAPVDFVDASNPTEFRPIPVPVRFIIDNNTTNSAYFIDESWWHPGNATSAPDAPEQPEITMQATFNQLSSDSSDPGHIGPGLHGLCVIVGHADNVTVSNKDPTGSFANKTTSWAFNDSDPSNDIACSSLYLNDNKVPRLTPIPIAPVTDPRLTFGTYADAPIQGIHGGETFYAHANASDSDQTGLTVKFVATLLNGTQPTNVTRTFDPCPNGEYTNVSTLLENCVHVRSATPTDGSGLGYSASITNFTFANLSDASENWSFAVHAVDAFGNDANDSTPLKIVRWPVQTAPANNTLLGLCDPSFSPPGTPGSPLHCTQFVNDSSRFSYASIVRGTNSGVLRYTIQVFDNATGIDDQWNNTQNLGWNLTVPAGPPGSGGRYTYVENGSNWIKPSGCTPIADITGKKTGDSCPDYSYLETPTLDGDIEYDATLHHGGAGQYNFSAIFRDQAGQIRTINQTFFVYDEPPRLSDWKINESQVLPGQPLHLHVNVTDDFAINQTYANFTRVSDNATFSIPLVNGSTLPQGALPADQLDGRSYNDTITTGHGKTLGVAGNYTVRFWAQDSFGNWNGSDPLRVLVSDTNPPVLTDAGADASSVEENENITFHATAIDASNETVILQILLGSEEVQRVNMTEDLSNLGNFTYTTNFTQEGSYTYNVWAVDSVGLESQHLSKTFAVRQNNPPNFDVKEPHVSIQGMLWAKAAPEIKVLVHDPENVSLSSITLSVGGVDITPDLWTYSYTTDPKGILVDYFVPQSQKFSDGDVVDVWMNATDMSNQTLAAPPFHFNFTVDDVPPTTVMLPLDPKTSYRADPRNVMNVSADTLFTLAASDDDGHPTGVASIQYQVCPLLCSGALAGSPYQGPFKLRGNPAYTGPRIYEIDYWSYDDVGNTNRSPERMLVYVDDLPPFLDPFGSVPQGRFVNATFGDDRSGVASAVVWWRLNGAPYQPTALDFASGVWSTVLPEGKKGDTMQYYLQATDRVGNTATFGNASSPYSTFVVGNHLPDLKITSPADGSTIAHQVQLKWDASDQDGDPLTFDVLYKIPGKSFVELQKLDSPDARSYVLDTTKLADGQYTFRVTANDGSFVAVSEVTVNILNSANAIIPPPPLPGQVAPGDPVLITAQITKANAIVEARVFRDGTYIGNYSMNDDGVNGDKVANDGVYSTTVRFDASGTYSVEIHALYQEDGQLKDSSLPDAGTFTVRLTPAGVFNEFGAPILIVGLLAVAGIGIAAWVLLRRR